MRYEDAARNSDHLSLHEIDRFPVSVAPGGLGDLLTGRVLDVRPLAEDLVLSKTKLILKKTECTL